MASILPEEEERAVAACRHVLGEMWTKDSVGIKIISGGYCNKLLLCTLDEKSIDLNNNKPKESKVLLRFLEGKNKFQILGEAGEALVFYIFAENGLGPKLLAAFPETRVEQFVQSRNLCLEDFEDPKIYAAVARKLARIHCLEVPVKKDPSILFDHYANLLGTIDRKNIDLKSLNASEQMIAKELLSVDMRAELKWLQEMVPKLKSRVVFCHNDYHQNNMMLRADCGPNAGYDQRLLIVDLEMSSYFYRGLDFGTHFHTANWTFADSGLPLYVGPPSDERKRFFIREYLKEWIRLNPEAYDPEIDTENNVLLESQCFYFLRGMIFYFFLFDGIVTGEPLLPIPWLLETSLRQLKEHMDYKTRFKRRMDGD